MNKITTLKNISEVCVASSDKSESTRIFRMVKHGQLRKIAPKIYTSNMNDAPDAIIKRNLFFILGQLYPHAVIRNTHLSQWHRESKEHTI